MSGQPVVRLRLRRLPVVRRIVSLVVLLMLAAGPLSTADSAETVGAEAAGLVVWDRIHAVLSHPRCANCHVDADAVPMWSAAAYGPRPVPHGMQVRGGASRIGAEAGLLCNSCHTARNSDRPHGPPGAPVWLLAPASMQWFGRRSAEICAQIQDPARNGGRTIAQVAEHVDHDPLVHWGWDPGPGREPAPGTKQALVADLLAWAGQGAPCPAP